MIDIEMLAMPFLISLCLTPLVKKYSTLAKSYAVENARTVHHGIISRIGGIAIYIAFIVTMAHYVKPDRAVTGIIAGGSIMFFAGLIDDLSDLTPRMKLLIEVIAAAVVIFFGVSVDVLRLPFGVSIDMGLVSVLFTLFWIVGITNAVNLIDGLDGLAGGMSVIVLVIAGSLSIIERRFDIMNIAFILAAAAAGFLVYNAYPASIFMGDCGSLFLGFMISTISLIGFKSSSIMTLALPILILMVPIIDTLSAIVRRTLKGQRFMEADKSHLHHMLMKQFGHRNTVVIMCGLTALFGLSAFVYMINRNIGFLTMLVILMGVELFIEKSEMISKHYHPMIGVYHRISRKWEAFRKKMKKNPN